MIDYISIMISLFALIVSVFAIIPQRQELRISNIKEFLRDVCLGMLSTKFKDRQDLNDKLKEIEDTFENRVFYDPVRRIFGAIYIYYSKEQLRESDYHNDVLCHLYFHRGRDYELGWELLFERFREYEFLLGIRKSSLGGECLGYTQNIIRKIKYLLQRKRKKRIEEKKYMEYQSWCKRNQGSTEDDIHVNPCSLSTTVTADVKGYLSSMKNKKIEDLKENNNQESHS